MHNVKYTICYGIGNKAKSNEYILNSKFDLDPINKQIELTFPIVTSATIHMEQKDKNIKNELCRIYVGKEFDLQEFLFHDENLEKYEIDQTDILKLMLQGYHRFCLLNYKKYDQIIVGLKEHDLVVSDYFALKTNINKFKKVCK